MDLSRLGVGERIACVSALVLLAVMFLGWFSLKGISADLGDVGGGVIPALEISEQGPRGGGGGVGRGHLGLGLAGVQPDRHRPRARVCRRARPRRRVA